MKRTNHTSIKTASLSLIFFLFSGFLYADNWTEDFNTGLAGTYTTGSQALSTGTWYTTAVYPEASGASYEGDHAARINDDTNGAGLVTPALNTCGTISFWYRELNSGGGTFEILKSYDNSSWTSVANQAFSGSTYTQFTFDVNDGAAVIYIKLLSDDNSGHLLIDDFQVTDYSSGPDLTAPLVTTYSPLDDATGVAINTDLVLTFDEAVQAGTGNIIIKEVSGGSTFQTIAIGSTTISGSTVTISHNDFDFNTEYYVEIAAGVITDVAATPNDYAGLSGSAAWNFTTGGLTYCDPNPSSVDNSGITNVSMGTIDNTTGTETGNYGDYSAQSTDVGQGATVNCDITYETGYTYVTIIWVDWNNDGDFDDVGEEVYSGESLSDNPTTLAATFTVPLAASLGTHRLRIGGADSGTLIPCYTGTYASYEDYSINVVIPGPIITATPSSLTGYTYVEGSGPSTSQSFDLSGTNLDGTQVTVTAPANYEVSTDNSSFSSSINISYTAPTLNATTIYVRLMAGLSAATYNGENITCNDNGTASDVTVSNDGEVTSVGGGSCGSETFTNCTVTATYSNGSFVGDNGVTWTYTASRDENGDANGSGINGNALMLRRSSDNSKVISSSVSGGIGDFTCKLYKGFTGAGSRQVELFVNGTSQGTSTIFDDYNEHIFTVSGINITGAVVVEIRNLTAYQVIVDNIEWTCGTPMPELSLEMPTSTAISCGDTYDYGIQTNGTNTNQTLTITNAGTLDLDITDFPLTGADAAEFSISPTSTSTTIAAGGTYDIVVTFSPTSAGAKSALITINSNDDDEGACVINFTGEGMAPCVAPTAQPTALDLTTNTTSTSIDGTFTAASPAADSYLIVYSTSNTLSSDPVDGTTYSPGDPLGGGTVLDNISGTSFTASSLTEGTEYYFFIFANNNSACSGGPLYNTTSPLSDSEITIPDTINWTDPDCISNSTIQLNWDAAPGNSTGYLIVVRQDATPHAITALDPNTQAFDTDYTAAPQFGSTAEFSRVVYKGTATSITITNLPTDTCVFKMYTYTIGSSEYIYSSGTQTTQTISLDDVVSAGATCGDSQSSISWSNPDLTCVDEILVVANETAGIDFSPSGDGTAYTANAVYAVADQVVYQGTGTSVTVTGLTNGTTYYYEIFTRKGAEWSIGVEVSCTPDVVSVLYPGDLAIVAINTDYNGTGDDEVCFFAFKDITNGTSIDFTDNGYERLVADEWADSEGTIRLERNGSTIEKGTVICFHGKGGTTNNFTINVCGSNDDASWNISSLNGNGPYDLNVNDQIWIMQDGNWTNPGGSHDATYDGNVLFGWTATGWKSAPGYDDTKGSTLFDGAECFNTNVAATANEDKVKFMADTSLTLSQSNWIGEINSTSNWTGYTDNGTNDNGPYNAGGLDYANSCVKFKIDNSLGNGAGRWQGGEDNNWFNCANWLNMKVPDETIDVTILSNAINEVNIDDTQEDASVYGPIAKCKNLTIQEGGDSVYVQIDDANDELQVKEILTLESNAKLYNDNSGTLTIEGDLIISDGALLDIHANPGTGSIVNLKGNWIDNNTVDNDTLGLFETDGQVVFSGSTQQTISDATGNETFYNIKINNANGVDLNGNRMSVSGSLDLTLGDIATGSDTVVVLNSNTNAISNASTSSYVYGYLRRDVNASGSYNFPIGTSAQYETGTIELNSSAGISNITASFSVHPGSAALVDGGGVPLALTVNGTTLSEMLDYGFWTITPDNSSYTVDYDVILTSRGHTNGGSDPAQHTIVKRDDASDDWAAYDANHDNSTQSGSGTGAITAQLSNMAAFSDFAIARDNQFPLPVNLLYFKATKVDDGVLLEWATASELNNEGFELNRSGQTFDFELINKKKGMGQSNYIIEYSYLDRNPIKGLSYYKLSQTDFDGTVTDLKTVSVNHSENLDYSIHQQILQINSSSDQGYIVEVYNTLGQKIAITSESEADRIYVDLSFLNKSSVYLIRIYNAHEEEIIKYKR